jgi:hypothetical protein
LRADFDREGCLPRFASEAIRLRPQFQHSVNWPSSSSPHPAQRQGFFTDSSGASVFLIIAFARGSFSS